MRECKIKCCIEYGEHLRVFGVSANVEITDVDKQLIQQLLGEEVVTQAVSFDRFILKYVLFYTTSYQRLVKRKNCVVGTTDGDFLVIRNLFSLRTATNACKQIIVGKGPKLLRNIVCKFENFSSSKFAFVVQETENVIPFFPSTVERKCICMSYSEDRLCVITLVNPVKTD